MEEKKDIRDTSEFRARWYNSEFFKYLGIAAILIGVGCMFNGPKFSEKKQTINNYYQKPAIIETIREKDNEDKETKYIIINGKKYYAEIDGINLERILKRKDVSLGIGVK
ncbi:hypothetical protein HZA33_01190 [Candidatus Pacearchaeota archaeon]|nr:hypothetical protein [Candidatus Pacearchaeota archaeon]